MTFFKLIVIAIWLGNVWIWLPKFLALDEWDSQKVWAFMFGVVLPIFFIGVELLLIK